MTFSNFFHAWILLLQLRWLYPSWSNDWWMMIPADTSANYAQMASFLSTSGVDTTIDTYDPLTTACDCHNVTGLILIPSFQHSHECTKKLFQRWLLKTWWMGSSTKYSRLPCTTNFPHLSNSFLHHLIQIIKAVIWTQQIFCCTSKINNHSRIGNMITVAYTFLKSDSSMPHTPSVLQAFALGASFYSTT